MSNLDQFSEVLAKNSAKLDPFWNCVREVLREEAGKCVNAAK